MAVLVMLRVMYMVNESMFIVLSLIMTLIMVTIWYYHGHVFMKSIVGRVHYVDRGCVLMSRR